MQNFKRILFIGSFLLPVGCSAYQTPPLTAGHPAFPEGVAAPRSTASRTLAYTSADIPSTRSLATAPTAQTGAHESHHSTEPQAKPFAVGEGKVIATVAGANQVVIDHGPIKGFMDAMTMGYPVESPSLLEGLQMGDKVRFTIDVKKKAIVKIEKLRD